MWEKGPVPPEIMGTGLFLLSQCYQIYLMKLPGEQVGNGYGTNQCIVLIEVI